MNRELLNRKIVFAHKCRHSLSTFNSPDAAAGQADQAGATACHGKAPEQTSERAFSLFQQSVHEIGRSGHVKGESPAELARQVRLGQN